MTVDKWTDNTYIMLQILHFVANKRINLTSLLLS